MKMGRLFKQRITRYRLAGGKVVAKGTPGARKCKESQKNGTASTETTSAC